MKSRTVNGTERDGCENCWLRHDIHGICDGDRLGGCPSGTLCCADCTTAESSACLNRSRRLLSSLRSCRSIANPSNNFGNFYTLNLSEEQTTHSIFSQDKTSREINSRNKLNRKEYSEKTLKHYHASTDRKFLQNRKTVDFKIRLTVNTRFFTLFHGYLSDCTTQNEGCYDLGKMLQAPLTQNNSLEVLHRKRGIMLTFPC